MIQDQCLWSLTRRHVRVQVWATSPILKPDLFMKWESLILTIILHCPHCLLTVPGMKLKTSLCKPSPSCVWDVPIDDRLTWLAKDTLSNWILPCSLWITSWCSWSLDCRLLWAVLHWTLDSSTALLTAVLTSTCLLCWISRSSWHLCCASASTGFIAAEASLINDACVVYLPWSSTCWTCRAS